MQIRFLSTSSGKCKQPIIIVLTNNITIDTFLVTLSSLNISIVENTRTRTISFEVGI